jgi:ribose-phosphate pyrophosphokinase
MAGFKQLTPTKRLQLFAGRSNLPLALDIAKHLGVELGEANLSEFADGEIHCRFGESIRGADVFIIQSHSRPVNEAIMEQLVMIDAAKRASAKRITAVCPYYGYSRQDRKAREREPITAKLVADMLSTAGVDRVVSVDLHSGQIQGFFDVPVDHLTAMPILADYVTENIGADVVIVSPDAGRVKLAERFARHLHAGLAIVHKRRAILAANQVEALDVVGNVRGRVCVIIDDMIDTAGTVCAGAEQLRAHGAAEVYAMATHGIFSEPAIDRIKNSPISQVVVTDTVPLDEDCQVDKIVMLSVARIIAEALDAVFEDTSVSEIFGGENQP